MDRAKFPNSKKKLKTIFRILKKIVLFAASTASTTLLPFSFFKE